MRAALKDQREELEGMRTAAEAWEKKARKKEKKHKRKAAAALNQAALNQTPTSHGSSRGISRMTPRHLAEIMEQEYYVPHVIAERMEQNNIDGVTFMALTDKELARYCEGVGDIPTIDTDKLKRLAVEMRAERASINRSKQHR